RETPGGFLRRGVPAGPTPAGPTGRGPGSRTSGACVALLVQQDDSDRVPRFDDPPDCFSQSDGQLRQVIPATQAVRPEVRARECGPFPRRRFGPWVRGSLFTGRLPVQLENDLHLMADELDLAPSEIDLEVVELHPVGDIGVLPDDLAVGLLDGQVGDRL